MFLLAFPTSIAILLLKKLSMKMSRMGSPLISGGDFEVLGYCDDCSFDEGSCCSK
ncbi:MAG: hypothetical protein ACTSRV_03060 [Candidatus Freyarchaeota archaeon]